MHNGQYISGHGIFVGHEQCPKCAERGRDRAGNNFGRWEDGHGYCFSCNFREGSTATKMLENVMNATKGQDGYRTEEKGLFLPKDSSKTFKPEGLQWLSNYGIIREEILKHNIEWSSNWQALIFPVRDGNGNLLAFQARRFGASTAKWTSHGNVGELTHIIHPEDTALDGPIVLVEDMVSAIRVGRAFRAMPLFGSNVSIHKLMRLRYFTKEIVFWLDADKYKEAIKASGKAELLAMNPKIVYTDNDPKDYTDVEIDRHIRG